MWRGILGKKIGMTQYFTEDGRRVGVTVVQAGPCPVLQLKTKETDGYDAYQLGFDDRKERNVTKPQKGHADKTGSTVMTVENWTDVNEVQVTSKSKGKGFQGAMKRHNYHGLRATHGVKTHHRIPGSLGSLTPARVVKGKPGPGHMGDEWVTMKGLKLAKVIPEKNLLLIQGSVPGPAGGYVIVRPAQPFVPSK